LYGYKFCIGLRNVDIGVVWKLLLIAMDNIDRIAKRVRIDLDEIIVRSDGSRATMREFVKEMLFYNPDFYIEMDDDGETWNIRRKKKNSLILREL
jgi:hypothetical protein